VTRFGEYPARAGYPSLHHCVESRLGLLTKAPSALSRGEARLHPGSALPAALAVSWLVDITCDDPEGSDLKNDRAGEDGAVG